MINFKKTTKGQSLIEIVVAIGIIAVVLVGVSDIITRSLNLASFQANKSAATNIAQDQLNYYRKQRDLQPTIFFSTANPGGCSSLTDSKFTCAIFYAPSYDSKGNIISTNMSVTVSWMDGDKNLSLSLSQILNKPTK
jgi:type II secretory pathway pseudopilin PulG